MKYLLILSLSLLANLLSGQNSNCTEFYEYPYLGLKICKVDYFEASSIEKYRPDFLHLSIMNDSMKMGRYSVEVSAGFFEGKSSGEEIWKQEFNFRKVANSTVMEEWDSTSTMGENQIYWKTAVIKSKLDVPIPVMFAIVFFKNQYYIYKTRGVSEKVEVLDIINKLILLSEFETCEELKLEYYARKKYEKSLNEVLLKQKAPEELLINYSMFEKELSPKMKAEEDPEVLKGIFEKWQNETINEFKSLKKCKNLSLAEIEYVEIEPNPKKTVTAYMGYFYITCDDKMLKYRTVSMKIDGELYLGAMKPEPTYERK